MYVNNHTSWFLGAVLLCIPHKSFAGMCDTFAWTRDLFDSSRNHQSQRHHIVPSSCPAKLGNVGFSFLSRYIAMLNHCVFCCHGRFQLAVRIDVACSDSFFLGSEQHSECFFGRSQQSDATSLMTTYTILAIYCHGQAISHDGCQNTVYRKLP